MFFTIPVDSFDLGGLVRRCLEDEEPVGDVNRDLFVEKRRGSQCPQSGNPCLLGSGLTSHAGTSKGLRIAKSADSCLVTGTTYKVKSEVLEKVGGKLELGLRHRCGLTARHHNQPPNNAQAERLQLGRWR